jgi:hypothetical protein
MIQEFAWRCEEKMAPQSFTENSLYQEEKRYFVRRDVAGADHQEAETAGLKIEQGEERYTLLIRKVLMKEKEINQRKNMEKGRSLKKNNYFDICADSTSTTTPSTIKYRISMPFTARKFGLRHSETAAGKQKCLTGQKVR